MAARILIDSNILVYAYDASEPMKQPRAKEVLNLIQQNDIGCLSVQCLSEFFTVAIRKYQPPMAVVEAGNLVQQFVAVWQVFDLTPAVVLEALRATRRYQLHYWDALLWAVAKLNGVVTILTEDFQHNRVIEVVRYINPFHAEFTMQILETLVQ